MLTVTLISLLGAVIVAAAMMTAAVVTTRAMREFREDARRSRVLGLLTTFERAIAEAEHAPQAILAWEPLARTARQLLPEEFRLLDEASGGSFPFSKDRLQSAHARWTADWLAWERTHDTEFKLKTVMAEQELAASGSPQARAKADAIEREKLDLYQRRYAEYIRVAKALQALLS